MGHGNVARSARGAPRCPPRCGAPRSRSRLSTASTPIARALRLNYETLKARVGRRADGERPAVMSARFVEVDRMPLIGAARLPCEIDRSRRAVVC